MKALYLPYCFGKIIDGGKYTFIVLIIGFLTFQSPLGLPGIQPVRKRAREPRAVTRSAIVNEDRILSDD